MQVLVIGGGNMGVTYARGLVREGKVAADRLHILERHAPKVTELRRAGLGRIHTAVGTCVPTADVVFLAVKPQDSPTILQELRPVAKPEQTYISIMAGVTIGTIASGLGVPRIVRAMPNLPAQLGQGMTSFTCAQALAPADRALVKDLLLTTGPVLEVPDEYGIDATTAISGSGPAYVLYFMQAMMEAAREMRFSPTEARQLVVQTFRGATELLDHSDLTPAEWIARVSSKKGTTEAAINTFRASTLHDDIKRGAHAALERAIELGEAD